jgi:hypothetical protein
MLRHPGLAAMNSLTRTGGVSRGPHLTHLLITILLVLGSPTPTVRAAVPDCTCRAVRPAAGTPILASMLDKFYSFIMSVCNSQQRMIQLGVIGMGIGLYIIWWRK